MDENIGTLKKATEAMREKIEDNIANFSDMPLSQELRTVQGDWAMKANPEIQEFRALVRDYASTLKALRDLQGDQTESAQDNNLENIRARFRVAK